MNTPAASPRYRTAVAALHQRGRFGVRLGLARTRALLRRLGNPEATLRGPLIGGTNGKGSVQALVAAALREQGLRVGQMPKPHLADYRERIVVDGRPLAEDDFAAVVEEALAATAVLERRHGPATEFEVLTAAGFLAFARRAVDVAVIEVGLGGRLDATNVWQGGVSAITNVALDHTEHLGPTIAAIAREKAAIIKRGDTCALTAAEGEALTVIARRARRVGVPLRTVDPLPVLGMDRRGLRVAGPDGEELRVGLLGRHQAANAALALAILKALAEAGLCRADAGATHRAFARARWPGRLELLALGAAGRAMPAPLDAPHPAHPDVLLDGAHNPHGAAALAAALDELRERLSPGRPVVLVGVLRDKDVAAMLAPLAAAPALADATVIATTVPDTPRSLDAASLAAAWTTAAGRRPARVEDGVATALAGAVEASLTGQGPLVVCGSLYLVGHVRKLLLTED